MKKPPCIRGLAVFKKGCPQRGWDGEDGCPAWVDKTMTNQGGTEQYKIAMCLDLYMAHLQYDTNRLLEGNQQATESFRNNMSTPEGPKPDPAVLHLVHVMEEHKRVQQAASKMIGQ